MGTVCAVVTFRQAARSGLVAGSTRSEMKSRSLDTSENFECLLRGGMVNVVREQSTSLVTPPTASVTATVAQVVIFALPSGLPRARAHTVYVDDTSVGSWKLAPSASVAFRSRTWKT